MLIEEVKEVLLDAKIMILEAFVLKGSGTEENFDEFRAEVRYEKYQKRSISWINIRSIPHTEKFSTTRSF